MGESPELRWSELRTRTAQQLRTFQRYGGAKNTIHDSRHKTHGPTAPCTDRPEHQLTTVVACRGYPYRYNANIFTDRRALKSFRTVFVWARRLSRGCGDWCTTTRYHIQYMRSHIHALDLRATWRAQRSNSVQPGPNSVGRPCKAVAEGDDGDAASYATLATLHMQALLETF